MLQSEHSPGSGFTDRINSVGSIRSAGKGFIVHLRAGGAAPSYIAPFEMSIAFLANFAEENDWPENNELAAGHLEQYLAWFASRPLRFGEVESIAHKKPSSGYLGAQYRRLHRFFGWLEERNHIPSNPMSLVARPKVAEKVVPILSDEEIVRILKVTDPKFAETEKERFLKSRNFAIFLMFIDSPARKAEIQGLSVYDINVDECTVKVNGKGNKERLMPLGKAAMDALLAYAAERRKAGPSNDELWVGCKGQKLSSDGNWIRLMIESTGRLAKVERLHAHRFRHTYAINWLRAGESERILKMLAGWKKIPETYYRTLGLDDVKRGHSNVGFGDSIRKMMSEANMPKRLGGRGML